MLTPLPKFTAAKFAPWRLRGGRSLGTPPALGLLLAAFQSPLSRSAGRGPVAAGAVNSSPAQKLAARPQGAQPTERMWKVPVLLLVLGRALLWVPAEGAVTVLPEDDITTLSVEHGIVTPGEEDGTVTRGASEEPFEVPTNTMSTDLRTEDWPTTVHAHEKTQSTTSSNVATSHSMEDTETTVEKDGFATGTLIGIIVGVLLAIGFIGGIIIVVVRKMSGRP